MKRLLAVILSVILVLVFHAGLAEDDFTIHSGVKFGMTLDEIEALEAAKGFEISKSDAWPNRLTVLGTIAGIEKGALIVYNADEGGRLFKAFYFLGNSSAPDAQRISEYNTVNDALVTKYGPSAYNSDNGQMADVPAELYGEKTTGFSFCTYAGGQIETYNQWMIDQADGSKILIDHFLRSESSGMYNYIIYVCFDAETVKSWESAQPESIIDDL